jgi:hypothetical protein
VICEIASPTRSKIDCGSQNSTAEQQQDDHRQQRTRRQPAARAAAGAHLRRQGLAHGAVGLRQACGLRAGQLGQHRRGIDAQRAAHAGGQRAREHRIGQGLDVVGLQRGQLLRRHLERGGHHVEMQAMRLTRLSQHVPGRHVGAVSGHQGYSSRGPEFARLLNH